MSTVWDPGQYLKFRDERTGPSIDLASRIVLAAPSRILDVGCGPGNSTEILHDRWPDARITGLDSSPDMIAQARAAHDWGEWVCADAAYLGGDADRGAWDLVFSNAALQWIPDHRALVEWYKGTGMRPCLERLPDEASRRAFEDAVLEGCRSEYPVQPNSRVIYPFRRLFFIAYAR